MRTSLEQFQDQTLSQIHKNLIFQLKQIFLFKNKNIKNNFKQTLQKS